MADKLRPFQRTYSGTDFMSADVTCQPSQWNKVGSITVPAQQQVTFGFGNAGNGVDTRGQAYINIPTNYAGTDITGKVRLALSNANETNVVVVTEERTERFKADANDRSKCVLLGEYPLKAKEDSKLIIYYYPDGASAETLVYNGSDFSILLPVTVYQ